MIELHHCGTVPIETDRLLLRPYVIEDAGAMYRNWADSAEVTRYLTWPAHSSADVTHSLLALWAANYDDPSFYHWGITFKGSNEVIGDISVVHMDEKTATAELGWCIGEAWWGQGVMPEAAASVRDYLFNCAGFQRIQAKHDRNNPKSGRVMQKIGMQYEGTMRSAGINNQGICDLVMYAVLKSDLNNKKENSHE